MCNMYKITTTRYFEVSRTISTGKIQHPPNTFYPKTNKNRNSPPDVPYFSYAIRNTMLGKAVESLCPKLRAGRPKNHGSNPGRYLYFLKTDRAVYGTYPGSYSLGTGCSFLGRTVTKTWSTLLTPIYCRVKSLELCLSSAYTYSRRE